MNPKKKMAEQECLEILKKANHGVLSMATPEGGIYGVPINYYYDSENGHIYFHSAKFGKKINCIKNNPAVSFVVIGTERVIEEEFTTHFKSVIITGKAKLLEKKEEIRKHLERFCDVVAPAGAPRRDEVIDKFLPAVCLVEITIEEMSGKRNGND